MTRAQFDRSKDIVMQRLSIIDVARWLGMNVQGDRAPCPFHLESSIGAFQFNREKGFCHCHSCHEGADTIGLVGKIMGISPAEALRELNSAFRLGLDLDAKISAKVEQQYEKILAHKRLLKSEQAALSKILNILQQWVNTFYPRNVSEEWDKRYIFALNTREAVEVYIESVSRDNAPTDTVEQIKKWQQDMRTLDPNLQEREKINTEILGYYADFIDGKIMLETLIREQEKAVKKYERL